MRQSLKALFIGHNNEEDRFILRMMSNHFSHIKITIHNIEENLLDLLMSDGPFSIVIINVDNRKIQIDSIYKKILETIGERPFIFIGGTNAIKSFLTQEILLNKQLNFVIETPLEFEFLNMAIQNSLDWIKKEEFQESIVEFLKEDLHPMRLRNFYLFDQLPYDIYTELTSTKFGKVIAKDKFYTHQLIQNYSKKGVKHLFLKKDEHLKFLSLSIQTLIKVYESKLTDKSKSHLLHLKTAFFIHQFIKAASVSSEVVSLTHSFIDSISYFIRTTDFFPEIIDNINDSGNITFAEQSVATAYVCEKMLIHMGWTADMSRGKLILASLLQDIHMINDDLIKIRSINDPSLKLLSVDDQISFLNHPQKAAQLSTLFNGFSDVDFILLEQHEHPSGDGFPNGCNSSSLTTISCIFIIANNFISRLACTQKIPSRDKEIIQSMKRIYKSGNFKKPMKALERAFK